MADIPSFPQPPSPSDVPANVAQLVNALHLMRDTLVQVSLLLQDFRFEVDEAERRYVIQQVNELLRKSRDIAD